MRRADQPLTVCVLEGHDFNAWRVGHGRGERPSVLPYGIERLEQAGLRVRHSDLTHRDDRLIGLLRTKDPVLTYRLRFNGALGQVLTSLPQLLASDVCLSIFEHHAAVYAQLRRFVPRLPPLVLISCYLAQWLRSGDTELDRVARRAASAAEQITVFSANQVEIIVAFAGVQRDRLHVIPYGIDTDFYGSGTGASAEPFVAAAGRDDGRDWPTFLAAAARTPDIPFKLATPHHMLAGLQIPDNVEHLGEIEHDDYRALLAGAAIVVVPTQDYGYPTGQSVLLEAMASGTPTVVPDTAALSDYVTDATRTYAVGDADALAARVRELWDHDEQRAAMRMVARQRARERFDTANMWQGALPAIRAARLRVS